MVFHTPGGSTRGSKNNPFAGIVAAAMCTAAQKMRIKGQECMHL
jgi:hypothetical protein